MSLRLAISLLVLLSVLGTALAEPSLLPVRQIFRSTYSAQDLESVWMANGQFRVSIGYSGACTIGGHDSLIWRSGQLEGIRTHSNRIPLSNGDERVAVALKSNKVTVLSIYDSHNEMQPEAIDRAVDTTYWIGELFNEERESISAVKSVPGDGGNFGLLFYSTFKEFNTNRAGMERTWGLVGKIIWKTLNEQGESGEFETGGVTALEPLLIPDEELPRVYAGATYEAGNYEHGVGGSARMACDLLRIEIESNSELAFHTFDAQRNEESIPPERTLIKSICAANHPTMGAIVFAVVSTGGVDTLALLDGDDLEPIDFISLPSEEIEGELVGIAYVGGSVRGSADLLCAYAGGKMIAVTIVRGSLSPNEYRMSGPITSLIGGNFDADDEFEIGITMQRRLNVYKVLPLVIEAESPRPPQLVPLTAYPNPFNETIRVNFSLLQPTFGSLKIYDNCGRLVDQLFSGQYDMGRQEYIWHAGQAPAGSYTISLASTDSNSSLRLILVK